MKNRHCAQLAEIGQIASKLSALDAKRSRLPKIVVTFRLQSGKTHLAQVNYCLDGVSQSFDNHQWFALVLPKRKLFSCPKNMLPILVNIPAALLLSRKAQRKSYLDIYKVFVYIPLKRLANSSVTSTHHLCEFNEIPPTTNENELL